MTGVPSDAAGIASARARRLVRRGAGFGLAILVLAACGVTPAPTANTGPSPMASSPAASGSPTPTITPTPVPPVTYTIPPTPGATPTDADVREATMVLEARLAALGIEGATVSGDVTGLRVTVPGASARDGLAATLAATGLVEFVPLDPAIYGTGAAPGPQVATQGQPLPVAQAVLFSGAEIADAYPTQDIAAAPAVGFSLTSEGAKLFADYTSNHVGEYFAIVLDGRVVSVPVIMSAVTGGSVIITGAGGLSPTEVTDLIVVLRSGPLPAAFRSGQSKP